MILDYRIRRANVDDAATIASHRAEMFYDMGSLNRDEATVLESNTVEILAGLIASGEYLGWLVEHEGKVIAGGGVQLRRLLPRPESLGGGQEAYILNIYTEPQHRRRGLARLLMETILDWCRQHDVSRVTLHPSDIGRVLYESLGFVPTQEMKWQK